LPFFIHQTKLYATFAMRMTCNSFSHPSIADIHAQRSIGNAGLNPNLDRRIGEEPVSGGERRRSPAACVRMSIRPAMLGASSWRELLQTGKAGFP
jgi:hypothetical protein